MAVREARKQQLGNGSWGYTPGALVTSLRLMGGPIWVSLLSLGLLAGCKQSAQINQGNISPGNLSPAINEPTITVPDQSPYFSKSPQLLIRGLCTDGTTVLLSGSADDRQPCTNSVFSFTVNQTREGTYNYFVMQTRDGAVSKPATLVWQHRTSVAPPDLTHPSSSIYSSAEDVLEITGNCETGSTITLSGDGLGETLCQQSRFQLDLPKYAIGSYSITVTQTDPADNQASVTFVWHKRDLTVSPAAPTIRITESQVFTAAGGSGVFTMELVENNSGAGFNPTTQIYSAGTRAGVIDKLRVTDSQGVVVDVPILVASGSADHFVLPNDSGDDQITWIQEPLNRPLKIQVVDRFENGVGGFPVLFNLAGGDAELLTPPIVITDSQGYATVQMRPGYHSNNHRITVIPLGPPLPDKAMTSYGILSLGVLAKTQNNGEFDLKFATGNNPDALHAGDFNSDGVNDLAILNRGDASIGIFINLGVGRYGPQSLITGLCTNPYDLLVADFTRDTYLDLVVSCSDHLLIYRGVGNGTFSAASMVNLAPKENLPMDMASGDFDGDSKLDLAVVSIGTELVAVHFGDGSGGFSPPLLLATGAGSTPAKVAAGNLDQANGDDLAVLLAGQNMVAVVLSQVGRNFAAPVPYSTNLGPTEVVLADYNGDTYLDVSVVNNIDSNVSVLLNDRSGGLNLGISTMTGPGPLGHAARDFNQDGKIDVVVSNAIDNTLSILLGDGQGNFEAAPPVNVGNVPSNVVLADANEDGRADILVLASGDRQIQEIPIQAGGVIGFKNSVDANPKSVVAADFNGDGYEDMAVTSFNAKTVTLLRGNGSGLFAPMGTLGTSAGPTGLLVRDFNGDGRVDIVVSNQSVNSLQVFLATDPGQFATPSSYGTSTQPTALASADFTQDGILDIVVTNSGNNSISLFPGLGDGTFGTRLDQATGAQPSSIGIGDFNDDGHLDLAISEESASSVGIFFGNGDGTFQTGTHYSTQTGPTSVVVGYFNPDANLDVAVANNLSNSVSVFFGKSNGSLDLPATYSAGTSPQSMRLVDINGDNHEDLIVSNGLDQTATVLLGSFFGDFSTSRQLKTDINAVYLDVADFNRDRILDLMLLDGTNNTTKIILGN